MERERLNNRLSFLDGHRHLNRHKEELIRYFRSIPWGEERKKV